MLPVILCLLQVPDRLSYGCVPDVDALHHPEALCYLGSWEHDLALRPTLDDSHILLFVPALYLYSSHSAVFAVRATSAGDGWSYLGD